MNMSYLKRQVNVGEYELNVYESGMEQPEVILFLHGSGPGVTALSNWENTITALSDSFHCLAPDMLGFADSSHPNPPPLGGDFMQLRVDTLFAMLDSLGLSKVSIVGNSMGGAIALRMASQKPERLNRLILMGTALENPKLTPGLMKVATYYNDPTVEQLTGLLAEFVYDPSSFGNQLQAIAEARVPCANREDVRRSHMASFAKGAPPLPKVDPNAIIHPALVIHGVNDKILEMTEGLKLLQVLPNADAHFIGQCGHWTQIEHAEKFQNQVRMFMAS